MQSSFCADWQSNELLLLHEKPWWWQFYISVGKIPQCYMTCKENGNQYGDGSTSVFTNIRPFTSIRIIVGWPCYLMWLWHSCTCATLYNATRKGIKKKNHINRWVEVSLLEYKVPRNRRVLLDSAKWKSVISAHKYLCSQIKNVNTF